RRERGARALECGQAQATRARVHVCGQVAFRLSEAPEDCVAVREQQLPGLREPRALAVAFDERRARFTLERGDLLADRRLCVRERVRGSRERAAPCELTEDRQACRVEHKHSLSIRVITVLDLMHQRRHNPSMHTITNNETTE